jgi:hypothetical protein
MLPTEEASQKETPVDTPKANVDSTAAGMKTGTVKTQGNYQAPSKRNNSSNLNWRAIRLILPMALYDMNNRCRWWSTMSLVTMTMIGKFQSKSNGLKEITLLVFVLDDGTMDETVVASVKSTGHQWAKQVGNAVVDTVQTNEGLQYYTTTKLQGQECHAKTLHPPAPGPTFLSFFQERTCDPFDNVCIGTTTFERKSENTQGVLGPWGYQEDRTCDPFDNVCIGTTTFERKSENTQGVLGLWRHQEDVAMNTQPVLGLWRQEDVAMTMELNMTKVLQGWVEFLQGWVYWNLEERATNHVNHGSSIARQLIADWRVGTQSTQASHVRCVLCELENSNNSWCLSRRITLSDHIQSIQSRWHDSLWWSSNGYYGHLPGIYMYTCISRKAGIIG